MPFLSSHTRVVRHAAVSALAALSITPDVLYAACPNAEAVSAYVEDLEAVRANITFSSELSLPDAKCAHRKLIAALPSALGEPVGYLAAFTNAEIRNMMGFESTMWGTMFGKQMLQSPAKVSVNFGAEPYWNPNLVLVVKDARLANATTPLQALESISAVVPYIGLEDIMSNASLRFNHFIAINVGFRGGILGKRIPVTANKKFVDTLANMKVVTLVNGVVYNEARGNVLMDGHPLNSAIWLARELKAEGITLKQGDLLALGSFSMSQPPRLNDKISVQYVGLPGNPRVAVQFD